MPTGKVRVKDGMIFDVTRTDSHSRDLQRLQNEGFELEIKAGFLLVKGIPYVNSRKEVQRGTPVVKLILAGDKTTRPDDHVA